MTDYSRDRLGPEDEDRLPWLEPVEEEPEEGGIDTSRLVMWLVAGLIVIGLIVGAVFWMRGGSKAASGDGALIKAPDSYYKERPADEAPAAGDDEIVYSASKGNEVESVIDTSSAAETPVNIERPQAAAPAPTPAPAVAKAAPKPATPAPGAHGDPAGRQGSREARPQACARDGKARTRTGAAEVGRFDGPARRLLERGESQRGLEEPVGSLLLPVGPHPVGGAGAVGRQDALPPARERRERRRHLRTAAHGGRDVLGGRVRGQRRPGGGRGRLIGGRASLWRPRPPPGRRE